MMTILKLFDITFEGPIEDLIVREEVLAYIIKIYSTSLKLSDVHYLQEHLMSEC